ncbi:MAG TPA: DUF4129 domain-containing protein [Candidatus Hydrogenedens sp.]|nr:DUF4129 domain-containing protein [Candidatus Hydrogenedens sp.]
MNIPDWMEDGSLSWSDKKEETPSQPPEEESTPTPPTAPTPIQTDFFNLNDKSHKIGGIPRTDWTLTDSLLSIINPFLILVLLWSVVFFLLDVRYVYTEVNDSNLRLVVFSLVLGIVAVNRIFATESVEDGVIYGAGLGLAISLYVVISTSSYGTGSVIYNLVTGNNILAFFSNMAVVIFLWWLTNRITYECCIDENPSAGEIGITTSLSKALGKSMQQESKASVTRGKQADLFYELEPIDPTQLGFKDPSAKDITFNIMGFGERLSKIPAGISILFFSIPVMGIFSLGLRVLVNGGQEMVNGGWFYLVLYVFSATLLLVMTSLGGLREYYRNRKVTLPSMLSITWVVLGMFIIIVAMVCAAYLPMPSLPSPFYVAEHETDPWVRDSTFKLSPVIATPIEIWQQQMILQKLGYFVITILVLVSAWVLFNAVKRLFDYWWQVSLHRSKFEFRWVKKLVKRRQVQVKVKKRVPVKKSKSIKFVNSLASPEMSKRLTPNEHIEYAYQALCALAEDLGVPKKLNETPLEFLQNLPKNLEVLREEIEEITYLYQIAVYSPVSFDEKILDRLRKFWISYNRVRNKVLY